MIRRIRRPPRRTRDIQEILDELAGLDAAAAWTGSCAGSSPGWDTGGAGRLIGSKVITGCDHLSDWQPGLGRQGGRNRDPRRLPGV
jgi:hypothetical protein